MKTNRTARRAAKKPTKRERTLLNQGKAVAMMALKAVVERQGLALTDVCVVLVHETAKARLEQVFELRSWEGPWSFSVVPKAKEIRLGPGQSPLAIPPESVMVVIAAGSNSLLTPVAPEQLLPPSDTGQVVETADGYGAVTLRQAFWVFFHSRSKDFANEGARDRHRRFVERVRGEVLAELARPGKKRPLIDIVFETAGGPALERMPLEELTGDGLMRAFEGGLSVAN